MTQNKLLFFIALSFSLLVFSKAQAADNAALTPLLQKIGQNYFKDGQGRTIYYPCTMGGEPLVIYSVTDGQQISSKSVLNPVYLKEGYDAGALRIPDFETTEKKSNHDLIIQTINPAADFVSITLGRKDKQPFYVDTANFPVVNTISGAEGTLQKFVSVFTVSIDDSPQIYAQTTIPTYNYNFVESMGLYVYSEVNQINANVASWNQNSKWTNGKLGRNYSNIPYRFSPLKTKDGGITSYDGYGFWICGSDQKQNENKIGKEKFYIDQAR